MKNYKWLLTILVLVFGIFLSNVNLAEAQSLPAGCATSTGYSSITGESCGGSTNTGCQPGFKYSPTTGELCSGVSTPSPIYFSLEMNIGSKGKDVRRLQQFLKDEGYFFGRIDGAYGARTARAVKNFQEDNNLDVTGAADTATLKVINSILGNGEVEIAPSSLEVSYNSTGNQNEYQFSVYSQQPFDKISITTDCKHKEVSLSSNTLGTLNCSFLNTSIPLIPTTAISHTFTLKSKDSKTKYVNATVYAYRNNVQIGSKTISVVVSPATSSAGPVIQGSAGPQSLKVNETGTWTIQASDQGGDYLTYSVVWGDENSVAYPQSDLKAVLGTQTATFSHKYTKAGTYYPVFYVVNSKGQNVQASLSVKVGGTEANVIKIRPAKKSGKNYTAGQKNVVLAEFDFTTITQANFTVHSVGAYSKNAYGNYLGVPKAPFTNYSLWMNNTLVSQMSGSGDEYFVSFPSKEFALLPGAVSRLTLRADVVQNPEAGAYAFAITSYSHVNSAVDYLDSTNSVGATSGLDSEVIVTGNITYPLIPKIISILPAGCTGATGYSATSGEPCSGNRSSANIGDTVYIHGLNFSPEHSVIIVPVLYGGHAITPNFISSTLVSFVVPDNAGAGSHTIAVDASNQVNLNIAEGPASVNLGTLTIEPSNASIKVGESLVLDAIFTMACPTGGNIVCRPAPVKVNAEWTSSNPSVVGIGHSGCGGPVCAQIVEGVSAGTANIKATYTNSSGNKITGETTVTVSDPVSIPIPPINPVPSMYGFLDAATCDIIGGWALNMNNKSGQTPIYIYDEVVGVRSLLSQVETTGLRQDVNNAYGVTGNHGFTISTPGSIKDGRTHTISVYAIENGLSTQLTNSPMNVTCAKISAVRPNMLTASVGGLFANNPTTPTAPKPVTPKLSKHVFSKEISKGSQGIEVVELQKFLNTKGYKVGVADGVFGQKVKEAVMKFQADNGVKVDGLVGKEVIKLLNK